MLVLALCLMTKLLEYSSGRVLYVQDAPAPTQKPREGSKRPCRRRARRAPAKTQQAPRNDNHNESCDNRKEKMGDPNCNNRGWCGEGWPRKGLLSTFSMSTYDDLARDLDANLAQIDMDEELDMHSVLTTVNNYSDSQSDASSKRACFNNEFQESVCRSEPLFSPVKDSPLTNLTNISVDSLDLEGDILLTCQANKDNYTIAFEDYSTAGEDSWCGSRKLFDVCSSSSDEGLGAGPGAPLSLVRRLFLKQQQRSEERMSTSSSSELDSSSRFCPANINALLNKARKVTQATQTEGQSLNQSVQTRSIAGQQQQSASRPHLQVCYPNYALPDLSFLKTAGTPPGATVHLAPRGPPTRAGRPGRPRPFSLDDVERLKDKGLSHVRDWDSLNILLPAECRQILEGSSSSSGYHSPATPRTLVRGKGSKDELNNNPCWDQQTSEDVLRLRAQVSSQLLRTVQFAPPNSPCHPPKDEISDVIPQQHRIPFSLPLNLDLSSVSDMVSSFRVACQQYSACLSEPNTLQTVALQQICPALTDILSHGLRPEVDTGFGMVPNSAWRVVEAAAHSGQIAKALNDLLMRVNADDMLTEGPLKVNAFIFGLINVGALGAWLSLLRTRESLIRKHYVSTAFLAGASSIARQHFDAVVAAADALPRPPAHLDLLLEVKRLQRGLRPLLSRPRSCVHENLSLQLGQNGPEERRQRRWSATASPKLAQALERLVAEEAAKAEASSEEPSEADSLETRDRFKKLQRQWELMSRPSRIPRLINSPSRPMAPSWPPAHTPSPPRPVELRQKPFKAPPPTPPKPKTTVKPQPAAKKPAVSYRGQPLRRVQTVRHRLGAESGHLSYDKGQSLEVLVFVDSKWLLCAKGALKGLVPREDVM